MAKRFLTIVVILALVFGGVFGYKAYSDAQSAAARAAAPAPTVYVSSAKVVKKDWLPTLSSVGSVTAVNGVEVTTQIAGQVKEIYFKSGQDVKKGQLLAYLDDSTYVQQLNGYLALLHVSQLDLKRKQIVYKTGGISRSTLDTAVSTYQQDLANVKYTQAQISYMHIRAPFSGVVGIRAINLGQYLSPGDEIVDLQSMKPLYVDFQIPERYLTQLTVGGKITVSVDARPGKTFTGKITALGSSVSTDNRNVMVRAQFSNKKKLLYPGQFASVSLDMPVQKGALTVPLTAVTYSIYGDTVFVLTKQSSSGDKTEYKVAQKTVTLDDQRGNTAVISGLNTGQIVAASGQVKLHPGMLIQLNEVATLPSKKHNELGAQ